MAVKHCVNGGLNKGDLAHFEERTSAFYISHTVQVSLRSVAGRYGSYVTIRSDTPSFGIYLPFVSVVVHTGFHSARSTARMFSSGTK